MRFFFLVCLMALCMAATGCSAGTTQVAIPNLPQAMPVDPPGGSYMLTANTYAGDALHKMLLLRMGSGGGILTTSFVDIHDFDQTSAFGRVASQQVGSRLGQYGFRVIEARLASTLSMTPRTGDFMLTRETARLLADTYDAHSVLVGSYSDEGNNIFVSVRVVRLSDNVIMAAYEYYLPRDGDVGRLLTDGRSGYGGDSVWGRHSGRTPAFGAGARGTVPVSHAAPLASSSPASAAGTPAYAAPTTKGGGGSAVPRYVDPNAKAAPVAKAASVAKAAPAPAAPAPVSAAPAPIPLEKDAPAPASIPGGS